VELQSELEAEQVHVDRAYERLDQLRSRTRELLASVLSQSRGGTPQFREERDVLVRTNLARLEQLELGDQALCFGRIDRVTDGAGSQGSGDDADVETFHIGRLGVSSEDLEPLVVDWRAPVAEPFYRATGRDPMGLVLRRHIAASQRRVTGIEDEYFARATPSGDAMQLEGRSVAPGSSGADGKGEGQLEGVMERDIGGPGALLAAVESARGGHMRDIISTIQREQDEIIRSPLAGVLVVQGGPGTGKTAVALHRAAYLLYTHRFPLERQGVLVIGPNPLFLRYIEQVLPSLGESGVSLSAVDGLVHGLSVRAAESAEVALLKGDARMAKLVARAVRARQRPLRSEAQVPYGSAVLHLSPEVSAEIVSAARRRPGSHNARRRFVEQAVVSRLAEEYTRALDVHTAWPRRSPHSSAAPEARHLRSSSPSRSSPSSQPTISSGLPGSGTQELFGTTDAFESNEANGADGRGELNGPRSPGESDLNPSEPGLDLADFAADVRRIPQLTEALERMWPRLSSEELIHDLFGSRALIALAAKGILDSGEQRLLERRRSSSLEEIPWTSADMALIDEARVLLGPRRARPSNVLDRDEGPRTYGHIVVDEAQDLSPMQLRMVARRSLSGSLTVVGDIGQATGPWAPRTWEDVTAHLPANRPPRTSDLTVSYRTPAEVLEVAARILHHAVPSLEVPTAARRSGVPPRFESTTPPRLAALVASVAAELVEEVSPGTTAVLSPASLVADLAAALDATGVASADPRREGLGAPLSLLPVDLANGLEFDAVIVVEPAGIVAESAQGLRALYMAITRPTRRLAVVHATGLPVEMQG
jgi:DNA helicase IV